MLQTVLAECQDTFEQPGLLDCCKEDSGVQRVDLPRLDQSIKHETGGFQVFLLFLGVRHQALIARFLTETLRPVVQNSWCR